MKKYISITIFVVAIAGIAVAVFLFFRPDFVDHPKPFELGYFSDISTSTVATESFGVRVLEGVESDVLFLLSPNLALRTLFVENTASSSARIEFSAETKESFAVGHVGRYPPSGVLYLDAGEVAPVRSFYQVDGNLNDFYLEERFVFRVMRPEHEGPQEVVFQPGTSKELGEAEKPPLPELRITDFIDHKDIFNFESLKISDTSYLAKDEYLLALSVDGEEVWRFNVGGDAEVVETSLDESLVATVRLAPESSDEEFTWGNTAVVLDSDKGDLVMEFIFPPTGFWWGRDFGNVSSVNILPDNRTFVVGDDIGRLMVVEVTDSAGGRTAKISWEKFLRGEIKNIKFDSDSDMIIADSADGHLRAFSRGGDFLWKAWVDGNVSAMDISRKYVVAKSGLPGSPLHLIRKKDGRTLFSLPVEYKGSDVLISSDEKYIWYGFGDEDSKGVLLTIEGRGVDK